jgi:hypothetical protein
MRPAVPFNLKIDQIFSRLNHCSLSFHHTMHKIIHLYGKNYGEIHPAFFLLERSTHSREGERGEEANRRRKPWRREGPARFNRLGEEEELRTAAEARDGGGDGWGDVWEERDAGGKMGRLP